MTPFKVGNTEKVGNRMGDNCNGVDCGVFAMRRIEAWFRETELKWDSGFPLAHTPKKSVSNQVKEKVCCEDCVFPF
ncbi:hypothetical protein Hanom_Chr06g00533931 [Helianthus anomalus]